MTSATAPSDTTIPPLPLGKVVQHRRSFASLRTIIALTLREMATSYGRSPGGYLWAILEPVGGIALLSLIFSLALRTPALGTNFPLFYATGMLPFVMYNGLSNKIAGSINFSRPLLAYPAVTYLDAILARFLINLLTDLMVQYVVFAGIMVVFDTHAIINLEAIGLALFLAASLALGMGILNCYLFTMFPLWQRAWAILMRPMFFLSGVFMLYDGLPKGGRDVLWYNPLIHVIGIMRRGFYSSYDATYASPLYVLTVATVACAMGLVLLRGARQSLLSN